MIRTAAFAILCFLSTCGCPQLGAHPMGNFSVNHYAKLNIGRDTVKILYLVDMAEIPTYQEIRRSGLVPKDGDASLSEYLDEQAKTLKPGLTFTIDDQPVQLTAVSRQVTFADGAGGLPTMKLAFVFKGKLAGRGGAHKLSYADNNFAGRSGWKEIVVVGNGAEIVSSSAPATDRSNELSTYSTDLLNSPPQQLSASVAFRTEADIPAAREERTAAKLVRPVPRASVMRANPDVPASRPRNLGEQTSTTRSILKAPAANTPRNAFTDLISTQRSLSFWVLLSAAFLAAGLGAMHALEPGHGKTLVAAYLVGSRGTAKHAVLLGVVVTAAHTAGVFLLGIVTLFASRYIVPEQLYPWLGAISGITVAALGVFMLLRYVTNENGEHSHAPGQGHSHGLLALFRRTESQGNGPGEVREMSGPVSFRELCTLGIMGGMIPCPAALVVLLSAFSLHRIAFGLFLITAFSVGLAAVLVTVGLLMVYTKKVRVQLLSTRKLLGPLSSDPVVFSNDRIRSGTCYLCVRFSSLVNRGGFQRRAFPRHFRYSAGAIPGHAALDRFRSHRCSLNARQPQRFYPKFSDHRNAMGGLGTPSRSSWWDRRSLSSVW